MESSSDVDDLVPKRTPVQAVVGARWLERARYRLFGTHTKETPTHANTDWWTDLIHVTLFQHVRGFM